ncbi:MAG TPA: aminoacetone oxidase family FAD-binding enzyme, partial [Saprospiraceae bacterium]|nr:aminoacetone oxidase family FAD-binding enzyme [Saprospiraceae bacterium]
MPAPASFSPPSLQIGIVGGGAAGFFAAIACAEAHPHSRVTILERGKAVLEKVRISGGGRCNVTHACYEPRELLKHYPRGHRELLGPFMQFGPADTLEWFERRGVRLKTEADGRMFPQSDDSASIVDCLTRAARQAGVTVRTGARMESLQPAEAGWSLRLGGSPEPLLFDRVLVATGSNPAVWAALRALGHSIVEPVPSLFTFNTKDTRLRDLSGLSVPSAQVSVPGTALSAVGPLLVTHWGLSGPAILRLSAWGARHLHEANYHFPLKINFLGETAAADIARQLAALKATSGKKTVAAHTQFGLPLRLWQHLAAAAGLPESLRWAEADKRSLTALSEQLGAAQFAIAGKSTFKEEFVTAGGVLLKEVNFKTFESRLHPGL